MLCLCLHVATPSFRTSRLLPQMLMHSNGLADRFAGWPWERTPLALWEKKNLTPWHVLIPEVSSVRFSVPPSSPDDVPALGIRRGPPPFPGGGWGRGPRRDTIKTTHSDQAQARRYRKRERVGLRGPGEVGESLPAPGSTEGTFSEPSQCGS